MLSGCQPFPYLVAGRFYLSPIFLTCPFWELALPNIPYGFVEVQYQVRLAHFYKPHRNTDYCLRADIRRTIPAQRLSPLG
jgi:hypothetical protein